MDGMILYANITGEHLGRIAARQLVRKMGQALLVDGRHAGMAFRAIGNKDAARHWRQRCRVQEGRVLVPQLINRLKTSFYFKRCET